MGGDRRCGRGTGSDQVGAAMNMAYAKLADQLRTIAANPALHSGQQEILKAAAILEQMGKAAPVLEQIGKQEPEQDRFAVLERSILDGSHPNIVLYRKDLAAECDRVRLLRERLREISEVWVGSEQSVPKYASEAYAVWIGKQMYDLAIEALAATE